MKKILLFNLLFWMSFVSVAQAGNPNKKQRILERKWEFIKHNLPLTAEESDKLQAVFFKYEKEKFELNRSLKKEVVAKVRNGKALDLSDKELNTIIDHKMDIDKQLYEKQQAYLRLLRKTLPPIKVIKYYKLEQRFKRELIKRLRHRKR